MGIGPRQRRSIAADAGLAHVTEIANLLPGPYAPYVGRVFALEPGCT